MTIETVHWFKPVKRFGFIHTENESKDVFVHGTEVESAGIETLANGQSTGYGVVLERGKGELKAI